MTNPIEARCHDSRSRLDRRLVAAGSQDECCRIYTAGFHEFGRQILPELSRLGETNGQSAPDYLQSRELVISHLTWLTSTCRRTCPEFGKCVEQFNQMQKGCNDPLIQKELKKLAAWGRGEEERMQTGKGKKAGLRARSQSQLFVGIGMVALLVLSLFVFARYYLPPAPVPPPVETRILPAPEPVVSILPAPISPPVTPTPPPVQVAPPESTSTASTAQVNTPSVASGDGIYRFTDAQGGIHFVASLDQVPPEFREMINFTPTQTLHTAVKIRDGAVLVPVELHNGDIVVKTWLILDTGATATTISEDLAARLGFGPQQTRPGTSRLADGRVVPIRVGTISRLAVGKKHQENALLAVLAGADDGRESEGLLGMSFMQEYRYELDMDHAVIRWKD